MFLLHHKKNASNHRFSKQLKNLQSNLLIGGFISIIYSSFASSSSTGGAEAPEAARPERAEAARPERAEAARPEDPEVPRNSTPCFAPHALKGQKLLAQGIALGNYGRKPVAL